MANKKNVQLMNRLEDLLSLQQWGDYKERYTKEYIKSVIPHIVEDEIGNLLLSSPGNPILSAHMDGVHDFESDKIWYRDKHLNRIVGFDGLNADDRCGIALALEIYLANPDKCGLIFTVNEEAGMSGSNHIVENNSSFLHDHLYCMVLDRKGAGDILGTGNDYCTQEVENWFYKNTKKFGYSPAVGILCDADVFNEHINCFNLSVGYDKHHTKDEFVDVNQFINAFNMLSHIIKKTPNPKIFVDLPEPSCSTSRSYKNYKWDTAGSSSAYPDGYSDDDDDNTNGEQTFREEYKEAHNYKQCMNCQDWYPPAEYKTTVYGTICNNCTDLFFDEDDNILYNN